MKKYQVRGGNSGYVQQGRIFSEGEQACLRKMLLRHHNLQEVPNENTQKVFNIGFYNEAFHSKIYTEQGLNFQTDVPVTFELSEDSEFSGHIDFIVDGYPEEHKSITSATSYKLVFEQGKYKFDNLVQLCTYMVALEKDKGTLVYTSYRDAIDYKEIAEHTWEEIEGKIKSITPEIKRIPVKISDEGQFIVDNVPVDLYVEHIVDFWVEARTMLETNSIYPHRPETKKKWGSPCDFCKLKSICNDWENKPFSTEEFLGKVKHEFNI